MKKKLLSLLLALAFVLPLVPVFEVPLPSMPVFAEEVTSGYCTYTVSNGKAIITDVEDSISGKITIPSTLRGYPVTTIGNYAFYDCSSLTSITIPDSVTSIGYGAFFGCDSLTTLSVASGNPVYHSNGNCIIETASKTLIFGCKDSVIPADGSVTSIGDSAFSGCGSLTTITIPDSVTTIGSDAFYGCSKLTSITIPDSVTTIGNQAFFGCYSLASITIPDSVTSIGYHAFYECRRLTSITIPDSVTTIGDLAFYNCSSLTSVIIPDSVTSIGDYAFFDCDSLTSITIPDSVTSIGEFAFDDCDSLTSITIPDSVTSIGDGAFTDCDSLTSITIPDSVTSIGDDAFSRCSSLTSITIPDSVTTIGDRAFNWCDSLTSITIPDSVTTIGSYAFYGCNSLTSITIPGSVTAINYGAFGYCESLTDVWYQGSKADRAKISIGSRNEELTYATWHHNTCKEHTYDNACDTTCNKCDSVRQGPSHIYDDACDADCNVCGQTRTPSDHVYDNACDTDCNVCGEDRTPPHDYTVQDMDETNHWMKCSLCGRVDESTRASHVYDNPCEDSDCNGCDFKRIPPHAFDSASDYECNLCLIRRPAAPQSESVVGTTVTLKTVEGCEYSTDGFTWQASPVFEDLDPVTTYTFYQRYAETAVYYASACSLGTQITTKKATPSAPAAPTAEEITKNSVTLVMEEGMQYSLDGTTWKTSSVFTGLRRGGVYTFYVRYGETSTHYASPASAPLEVQTLKDPQLAPKAPSLEAVTGISVTLVSAEGIEYSMDGETWQSEATFRGLTPDTEYTFYQRQAEKDEYYASPASEALVVKTPNVRAGDADGNEAITIDDALYVLFHTNFPEDYPVNQDFDFDNNGKVDMDDAIELLYYVFFPERYPLF